MHKLRLNEIISKNSSEYIGDDNFEKIEICDGFCMIRTNFKFNKPFEVFSSQNTRKMVVTMGLAADATYKNHDGKSIEFKQNYATITSFDKTDGVTFCQSDELCQLRFVLDESFLRRNFGEKRLYEYGFFKQNSLNLLDFAPLKAESQISINQMFNEQSDLKLIFLQANALEILYNELSKQKQKIFLDSYDKNALMLARDLILNEPNLLNSISQIAKKVHLSEVKLKNGFKEFFNTTPYNLLKSQKLRNAKKLLQSGEYNINEVANLTGYKYASNFTLAFTKEFRINPKEILKSSKYY